MQAGKVGRVLVGEREVIKCKQNPRTHLTIFRVLEELLKLSHTHTHTLVYTQYHSRCMGVSLFRLKL